MPRIAPPLALLLAVAAGVGVELVVARLTGARESWDAPGYWLYSYPAMILLSALLGWLSPPSAPRCGFVAVIAQLLTMMLRTGGGNLWPLALVTGALLGVPCALAARAGARIRGRSPSSPA